MKTQYLIGTSGWNYSAWKGPFYPKDLPQKEWLNFYMQYFPVVEINSTFYRSFKNEVFLGWRNKAKGKFKYVIKVGRTITHVKYLKDSKELIKKVCRSVALLENKLALLLLQLPSRMPYNISRLEEVLSYFDNPKKVVVEFRNKKWLTAEVKNLLQKKGSIFCIADSPAISLINWVTAKTAYIRLHGRRKWFNYNYSKKQLTEIANFARGLERQGARKIFILFNNDYCAYATKNAKALRELLGQ